MSSLTVHINHAAETLKEVSDSLQREFEFYSSVDHPNEKVLKAKKKQQNAIEYIFKLLSDMNEQAEKIEQNDTKLRGCLLFHGVSPSQAETFIGDSVTNVKKVVKKSFTDKIVQIPQRLTEVIGSDISDPLAEEIEVRRELTKVLNPKYYTKKNNNVKSDQKSTS